jgi:hypothetical protein
MKMQINTFLALIGTALAVSRVSALPPPLPHAVAAREAKLLEGDCDGTLCECWRGICVRTYGEESEL